MGAVQQSMRLQVIFIDTYKSDNMTTRDLMIGDYVTFKDCQNDDVPTIVKIEGLGYQGRGVVEGALVTIDGDENGFDLVEIDDEFVGIPLTEEILQENFPSPEEIVWWPLNDGSFRVEMQDDTHLIIGKYNYVHELQHALRLFGKEGKIEL